jgi:hypothetical protein
MDLDALSDFVAAHGYPPRLVTVERLWARVWAEEGRDLADIAAEIVFRRHAYEPGDAEPGTDPAKIWCRYCNCTPAEHRVTFGAVE